MSNNENSNEVPEKVMRLIAALMARANHPNANAAEAALCNEQLQRIMLKHSISDAKANATQQKKSQIGAWHINLFGSYIKHRATLLSVVGTVFSCRIIEFSYGKTVEKYELVGREGDLAMVYTLFEHLLAQLDTNLNGLTGRSMAYKKSYILNFSYTVQERLEKLYKEELEADDDTVGTELVLANIKSEVDLYIKNEHSNLRKGKNLSNESYAGSMAGADAATKADIFLPGARFDANKSSERNAIHA